MQIQTENFELFLSRSFARAEQRTGPGSKSPADYFVFHILDNVLQVEHYNYKEKLLRMIDGHDARSNYLRLIHNGWVSTLDHGAYLGKELVRAESSMKHKSGFVQDGA